MGYLQKAKAHEQGVPLSSLSSLSSHSLEPHKNVWEEGDHLISLAFRLIAEDYQRLPQPWPAIVGPEWGHWDEDIDRAYQRRDKKALRRALGAFATFANAEFGRLEKEKRICEISEISEKSPSSPPKQACEESELSEISRSARVGSPICRKHLVSLDGRGECVRCDPGHLVAVPPW